MQHQLRTDSRDSAEGATKAVEHQPSLIELAKASDSLEGKLSESRAIAEDLADRLVGGEPRPTQELPGSSDPPSTSLLDDGSRSLRRLHYLAEDLQHQLARIGRGIGG